jgi:hypothetical protein
MRKRRRSALAVLALAVAAVFLLSASPASAGTQTYTNACRNSAVGTNWDQISVTMTGNSPAGFVSPGDTVPYTNNTVSSAIPGAIFVAGYNLGLLVVGPNTIPATVHAVIDASNTTQLSQSTNNVDTSLSTTITDPDGTPGSGDESATDASASVTFNDMTWTAGASGTINFHEHNDTAVNGVSGGGFIAVAHLAGGIINVQFHCTAGSVTGSNPGVPTFFDAPTITSTGIDAFTPVANAGPDQTVGLGAPVTLDASGSTDGDLPNDTLSYQWTAPAGITLSDPTAVMPTFTSPTSPATLTFGLTVTDQAGKTSTDSVTVNAADQFAPVANAGPDQTVNAGSVVTLDGSASTDGDLPNDALTYQWTQTSGPPVTLSDPTAVMPTFTTVTPGPDTYTFGLTVTDQAGKTSTDSVTVTTVPVVVDNFPPVANAGPDQSVNPGVAVTLNGSATDGDLPADTLTFAWTQTAGTAVTLTGANTATPTFTAPGAAGDLTFSLTVTDQAGKTSTDSVTVTVVQITDLTGLVIVNGPVTSSKTAKNFVFKVTNLGTSPTTINVGDVTSSVDVNGTATGSVSVAGLPVTIGPGASKRLKLSWSYDSLLATGDAVVFHACVNVAGDIDTTNNCDDQTATAK